jgi:Ca-activated chloride channel family protein
MKLKKVSVLIQIFCICLLASTIGFSQNTNSSKTVYFRVNVADKKGRFITSLTKENFKIEDEKVSQTITYFSSEEEPAAVEVLLDVSSSMSEEQKFAAANSALKFVQNAHVKNDYSVISFSDEIKVMADWGSSDKQIVDVLNKAVKLEIGEGQTSFNDALLFSLERIEKVENKNKILLVYSDGEENSSGEKFLKVKEKLKTTDVRVFSFGITIKHFSPTNTYQIYNFEGQRKLEELAELSGGMSFFSQSQKESLENAERLVQMIQTQYVIGFEPKLLSGNKDWHSVKIKVENTPIKSRSLTVISRSGYYSSKIYK